MRNIFLSVFRGALLPDHLLPGKPVTTAASLVNMFPNATKRAAGLFTRYLQSLERKEYGCMLVPLRFLLRITFICIDLEVSETNGLPTP